MRSWFPSYYMSGVFLLALVLGWAWAPMPRALAEEDAPFGGRALEGKAGTYLATARANLRAKPQSKGKIIGKIPKGAKVGIAGKAKGTAWLAIRGIDGEELKKKGFAYGPTFVPLIDGTLKDVLTVKVPPTEGPACTVDVLFEGKTVVEEDMFEIADYEAVFQCDDNGNELVFTAHMFMTEAPFDLGRKPRYQLNVDLRGVGDAYDEPFSVIFIYDHDKGRLGFDGVTLRDYARPPDEKARDVEAPPEAIAAAVEIAPQAWNKKVWEVLRAAGAEGQ